jgi:hypothetical protein
VLDVCLDSFCQMGGREPTPPRLRFSSRRIPQNPQIPHFSRKLSDSKLFVYNERVCKLLRSATLTR